MALQNKKGFDDIVIDMISAIRESDIGITNMSNGSVSRLIIDIVADEISNLYEYGENIYDSMNVDYATGEELDKLGLFLGVTRGQGKKAIGQVTFYTGDSPATSDIVIPSGYVVATEGSDGDMIEFETIGSATLPSGSSSITVDIRALENGYLSIGIGKIDTLGDELIGINSCSNSIPINNGSSIETDDEYRQSIKSSRYFDSSCNAIKNLIEDVDGVRSASITTTSAGNFTVAIRTYLVTTTAINDMQSKVNTIVNNNKCPGTYHTITIPTPTDINVAIGLYTGLTQTVDVDNVAENSIKTIVSNWVDSLSSKMIDMAELKRQIIDIVGSGIGIRIGWKVSGAADWFYDYAQLNEGVTPKLGTLTINGSVV